MKRMYTDEEIKSLATEEAAKSIADLGISQTEDGLNVDGKLSADEIVENMEGYSYETAAPAGTTLTYNYIGAVKNGNKLTIVIDGKLTPTDGTPYNPNLGWFKMPPSIIEKLVPTDGIVAFGTIGFYTSTGSSAPKQIGSQYYKSGTDSILVQLMSVNPNASILVANTTYRFRIEQTFLLSENLAPQN